MTELIDAKKTELFETMPIPKAVAKLAVPTVLSTLVMVIYSLADTYFVGLINSPVQTAAVTYAAPVLLAFNALNNLFGTGCSSLMSRALGSKDYDTVPQGRICPHCGSEKTWLLTGNEVNIKDITIL